MPIKIQYMADGIYIFVANWPKLYYNEMKNNTKILCFYIACSVRNLEFISINVISDKSKWKKISEQKSSLIHQSVSHYRENCLPKFSFFGKWYENGRLLDWELGRATMNFDGKIWFRTLVLNGRCIEAKCLHSACYWISVHLSKHGPRHRRTFRWIYEFRFHRKQKHSRRLFIYFFLVENVYFFLSFYPKELNSIFKSNWMSYSTQRWTQQIQTNKQKKTQHRTTRSRIIFALHGLHMCMCICPAKAF